VSRSTRFRLVSLSSRSPKSEATVHFRESGLQKILVSYRNVRPEEFRIATSHYSVGSDQVAPAMFLRAGKELHYLLEVLDLDIDVHPERPDAWQALNPGELALLARFRVTYAILEQGASGDFSLDLGLVLRPAALYEKNPTHLGLEASALSLPGFEPKPLRSILEHGFLAILTKAIDQVSLPATFNLPELFRLMVFDVTAQDETVQFFSGLYLEDT